MVTDPIRETLTELEKQAEEANGDQQALLEVLDQAVEVAARAEGALTLSKKVIEKAILAGVNTRDLYDRPFSGTTVRAIYNELREQGHDLPELSRGGPRRSRRRVVIAEK